MPNSTNQPTVICLGEILWDCLPAGLFLGGAPTNVAYHLGVHGCTPLVVAGVGDDFLGEEARRRVAGWGMTTEFLGIVPDRPTGTVQVDASIPTNPRYTIVDDVAWDQIPAGDGLIDAASRAAALVFGTLSLRHAHNRATLDRVLQSFHGLRVLDINLRPPFNTEDAIDFAASRCDLLKLNDAEAAGASHSKVDDLPTLASQWATRYNLKAVCITAGDRGAGLLWGGIWYWEAGRAVDVKDTVGAGDAFLAALLASLLGKAAPAHALARACRTGELVASRSGGTPIYDLKSVDREVSS